MNYGEAREPNLSPSPRKSTARRAATFAIPTGTLSKSGKASRASLTAERHDNRRSRKPDVQLVETRGHLTVWDILLDGIGGALPAIAAMRFALGSFFVLSGIHKLTNKERHKTFVETLRVLGIPHIGILQWFVPGVEFLGGLGVAVGFLTPLAALGLLVICSVALFTSAPTVVASYKPIDRADRVD